MPLQRGNCLFARCRQLDEEGHGMLFGNEETSEIEEDNELGSQSTQEDEDSNTVKDSIRKHQFDHNRNTCMTNNYPEMLIDQNVFL